MCPTSREEAESNSALQENRRISSKGETPAVRGRELLLIGRAAVLLGLAVLLLDLFFPGAVSLVHNNLGSLRLNRALLAEDLTPEEETAEAVRAGRRFQRALAWNPLNGEAYQNLATIYAAWQDDASSTNALSRAAALIPRDAITRFKYGQALAARGDEEGAIHEWRAAGAAPALVIRGQALAGEGAALGAREGAVRAYRRAVAVDPELAEAHLRLGQALSRLGRQAEALEAFAAAAEVDRGSSSRPYLLQAEVHVVREEWTAALVAYGEAAASAPYDPEPHYRRGWVLSEKLGDDGAAAAAFEMALEVDPEHVPSRRALGVLEAGRGDCDAAAEVLEPLVSGPGSDGGAAALHVQLGRCLLEQGRDGEALGHLERAAALGGDSVDVLLGLGQAYAVAGRFGEAVDAYRQALALAPENEEARQALEELGALGSLGP
jgi:tetratricopeptide (TPR) repeat protein